MISVTAFYDCLKKAFPTEWTVKESPMLSHIKNNGDFVAFHVPKSQSCYEFMKELKHGVYRRRSSNLSSEDGKSLTDIYANHFFVSEGWATTIVFMQACFISLIKNKSNTMFEVDF